MIQFNLLPDVKLEYIRAKRLKRTLISVSAIVAASSLAIALVLFLGVSVAQKKHLSDLDRDVKAAVQKLESTPDIDKIITVQNQLNSLTGLHDAKPAASRLLGYLSQTTPVNVTIADINVDFTVNTFTIKGGADDLVGVNTFIDTLKFTTYETGSNPDETSGAFSQVVLTSFSIDDGRATYEVSLNFDPVIFNNAEKVTLRVPQNAVTTRSQISSELSENALFKAQPVEVTPGVQ